MSDHHLIVNVEEQQAKRLLDAGFPQLARQAVTAAATLPSSMPLEELALARRIPVTKEEAAARKAAAEDVAFARIVAERDALLAASDWTQLPDSPVDQKAWAAYRQKLRDLPTSTKDAAKPAWPKPPKEKP